MVNFSYMTNSFSEEFNFKAEKKHLRSISIFA